MRLLFRQRLFSWFDSYDIYDEAGNTVYTVEGKLAWGHCLHILNAAVSYTQLDVYKRQQVGCLQRALPLPTSSRRQQPGGLRTTR